MKSYLVYILFFLIPSHFFTQSIQGLVKDQKGFFLFGVSIYNTNSDIGTTSDINGKFIINAKTGDVFRFSYLGKQTIFYTVRSKDTGLIIITMPDTSIQLKDFVVDGKRLKKVSAKNNENIIDYYSLGINTFLVLKRIKKKYIVSIEGHNKVYQTFMDIGEGKPTGLFYDNIGRFYLLSKDSVVQFHFDENFMIIDVMDIFKFKKQILPTLHYNDSIILIYSFLNHNKTFKIEKLKKAKIETLYNYSDKLGIKNASQNYQEIISLYMQTTPSYDNMIKNKTWDGDITKLTMSLANPENEEDYLRVMQLRKNLFQAVNKYDKISSSEVEICSFYLNNILLIFNFNNDSLTVQNTNGDIIHKTNVTIANKGFTKKVVLDREQKTFYGYSINNGVVTLDKINLQTGKTTDSYELNGVTFPENLKVIDGWAYFIKPNNKGFHKLYRIALE